MLPALKGIMSKMPLVGVSFAFAALAVTGVPPFNGFFSKFSILAGGFQRGQADPLLMVLVVIAVIETIGSFAWLFWIFSAAVPGEPSAEVAAADRYRSIHASWCSATLAILTLVSGYFAATWMG